MDLGLVLEMAASAVGNRVLVQDADRSLTAVELDRLATAAAGRFTAAGADAVVYVGTNGTAYAVCLFGAARAGIPLVPLNYRASDEQLAGLLAGHPGAVVVSGGVPGLILPVPALDRDVLLAELADAAPGTALPGDTDAPAVLLYTSGTTAAPKAAVLRHRHLTAYLMAAVEFGSAADDDAALVTVPPYHVAGLTNLLSNTWSGRRLVYLEAFSPATWLSTVRDHGVTQAMVVPTMLAKIVEHLGDAPDADVPTLRTLSYGGSRMPLPVLERALAPVPADRLRQRLRPHRDELHDRPARSRRPPGGLRLRRPGRPGAARLSVGQPVARPRGRGPRRPTAPSSPPGEQGLVFVRGEQVSGEYATGSLLDEQGWFPTRDRGWLDADGYLFIEGRADDTIIRGGENIAPAEIEDVLSAHPDVTDVVVLGVPDDEWGQRIEAVVVTGGGTAEQELRDWVRARLRSSKTPDRIVLPHRAAPHRHGQAPAPRSARRARGRSAGPARQRRHPGAHRSLRTSRRRRPPGSASPHRPRRPHD